MHSTCLINYWNCCKLISHGSTTYYLHTIDAPNQVGQACEFSPERLELPTNLPHHLPNIPQYRYITGCDSTMVLPEIVTFTEEVDPYAETFRIYPNPLSDFLTIDKLQPWKHQVKIFDQLGRCVLYKVALEPEIEVDVMHLQPGMYFVKVDEIPSMRKIIKI